MVTRDHRLFMCAKFSIFTCQVTEQIYPCMIHMVIEAAVWTPYRCKLRRVAVDADVLNHVDGQEISQVCHGRGYRTSFFREFLSWYLIMVFGQLAFYAL